MKQLCPDCKNQVINNNIEIYCPKCGLVVDYPIDHGPEVSNLNANAHKFKRTGEPITYMKPFAPTIISKMR